MTLVHIVRFVSRNHLSYSSFCTESDARMDFWHERSHYYSSHYDCIGVWLCAVDLWLSSGSHTHPESVIKWSTCGPHGNILAFLSAMVLLTCCLNVFFGFCEQHKYHLTSMFLFCGSKIQRQISERLSITIRILSRLLIPVSLWGFCPPAFLYIRPILVNVISQQCLEAVSGIPK